MLRHTTYSRAVSKSRELRCRTTCSNAAPFQGRHEPDDFEKSLAPMEHDGAMRSERRVEHRKSRLEPMTIDAMRMSRGPQRLAAIAINNHHPYEGGYK
jgi:hypothetical protein